jgi:hypothetical protein
MSKAGNSLLVVRELKPTLETYHCAPVDLILELIERLEIRDLTISDIGRAIRVYTGVEYTACDDSFEPCTYSKRKCTIYLHPDRVRKECHKGHIGWLRSLADAWLRKADNFEQQCR